MGTLRQPDDEGSDVALGVDEPWGSNPWSHKSPHFSRQESSERRKGRLQKIAALRMAAASATAEQDMANDPRSANAQLLVDRDIALGIDNSRGTRRRVYDAISLLPDLADQRNTR